jgi:hypothetical protein
VKHTTANVGKRLHVILNSGRQFDARLISVTDRYYTFQHEGRVARKDVRSVSILRKPATASRRRT